MALSANVWLKMRYADPTCGGRGSISAGVSTERCPDCKGSGFNEARIELDAAAGLIPQWVLEQTGRA